ncbi:hypothetical protein AB1207_22220 [Kineococcus endophyticus]|uniref:Ribosomally synthesized peptide with SipW-like signal peptide n=1 Tax=Kineococcus endophyticus TaxID=1181883 RepID=A0ABV3PCV8_9ACTN
MTRREGIRFGFEAGAILLAVVGLVLSFFSTRAALDAAEASRDGLRSSLDQAKLQGAVPEFLETAWIEEDGGRRFYPAGLVTNSDGTMTVSDLQVINKGLAATDVRVTLWPGEATINEKTRQLTPDPSIGLSYCTQDAPLRLEPQLITEIEFTTRCSMSEAATPLDRALLTFNYGTGASDNVYVRFGQIQSTTGGSGGSL